MENVLADIKKLRNSIEVYTELETLKEIRGCYNHFLASYEANDMKVAAVQIQLNRIVVNKAINELYLELDEIKALVMHNINAEPTTLRYTYKATPDEVKAIMSFNTDPRFTITE